MVGIPKKPEDIFADFTADYKNALHDDLKSIILFGSGARNDYIPGKSDLNFLIVLSESAMERFDLIVKPVSKWRKRKVAIPLFMTEAELYSSVDCYPVEFLNMQRNYRTVYGKDVLADLRFDPEHVRLQCERELKGKALLLLQRYAACGGDARGIRELITDSIMAFISIFRALLHLKGLDIPENKREVIRATAQNYVIDFNVFIQCIDIKEGVLSFSKQEVKTIFGNYLKEVRRLADLIDNYR